MPHLDYGFFSNREQWERVQSGVQTDCLGFT